MEIPKSLTTCNETNVEKVTQDESNIKEEYKDALSCTGFEKDEWYKYNTIVNVLMFALLFLSVLSIVGMTGYLAHNLYLAIQKDLFIPKVLNKEL